MDGQSKNALHAITRKDVIERRDGDRYKRLMHKINANDTNIGKSPHSWKFLKGDIWISVVFGI